jgi:nucleoporin NDC1
MKEGVVKIVQTFGARLTAFRFPLRIAQKLQGFADYY